MTKNPRKVSVVKASTPRLSIQNPQEFLDEVKKDFQRGKKSKNNNSACQSYRGGTTRERNSCSVVLSPGHLSCVRSSIRRLWAGNIVNDFLTPEGKRAETEDRLGLGFSFTEVGRVDGGRRLRAALPRRVTGSLSNDAADLPNGMSCVCLHTSVKVLPLLEI